MRGERTTGTSSCEMGVKGKVTPLRPIMTVNEKRSATPSQGPLYSLFPIAREQSGESLCNPFLLCSSGMQCESWSGVVSDTDFADDLDSDSPGSSAIPSWHPGLRHLSDYENVAKAHEHLHMTAWAKSSRDAQKQMLLWTRTRRD